MSSATYIGSSVLVLGSERQVLARGKGLEASDVNLVGTLELVVVLGVNEGESEHALLLQVGLVDTGEAADDDGKTAEEAGLESGVFTGRTLAVVVVTDDNPLDTGGAVSGTDLGNTTP